MITSHIRDILRTARTNNDIGSILVNLEDFYDLLDSNLMGSRLDVVTIQALQEQGLYAHIDGFSVYCSKQCPPGQFALAQKSTTNDPAVTHSTNLMWTTYQKYDLPKNGQRYFYRSGAFIAEVQGLSHDSDRYGYITILKVVQNLTSQYNVGDTINEYNMLGYEYLNGQDKPIL